MTDLPSFDINSPGIEIECCGCGNLFVLAEIPSEALCEDCRRDEPSF